MSSLSRYLAEEPGSMPSLSKPHQGSSGTPKVRNRHISEAKGFTLGILKDLVLIPEDDGEHGEHLYKQKRTWIQDLVVL